MQTGRRHQAQISSCPQSLPLSPNSSRGEQFFTPPNTPRSGQPTPSTNVASGKVPKLLQKILRGGKTVEFKDPLPDRQSWIQKNFVKMQAKSQAKAKKKRAKVANKALQSEGTSNN